MIDRGQVCRLLAVVAGVLSLSAGVARATPGDVDTSFGSAGAVRADFGAKEVANSVALQPDGKIVLAGGNDVGSTSDLVVVRLLGDAAAGGGGVSGGGSGGSGAGTGGGGGPGGGQTKIPRCAGRKATIVGTSRADKLKGTKRAAVIVALGGRAPARAPPGRNPRVCDTSHCSARRAHTFNFNVRGRRLGGRRPLGRALRGACGRPRACT
ncbi:MAG TPA: hypothetical protein VHW04_12345 [Solirubrobacteraceae bacterium]|nr:hypothetical protein [Solirubrobacteraceae bacterium]